MPVGHYHIPWHQNSRANNAFKIDHYFFPLVVRFEVGHHLSYFEVSADRLTATRHICNGTIKRICASPSVSRGTWRVAGVRVVNSITAHDSVSYANPSAHFVCYIQAAKSPPAWWRLCALRQWRGYNIGHFCDASDGTLWNFGCSHDKWANRYLFAKTSQSSNVCTCAHAGHYSCLVHVAPRPRRKHNFIPKT